MTERKEFETDWWDSPEGRGCETLLLVDDEETMREIGRQLLEAMGYEVLLASDGMEALEVFSGSGKAIDMVLLDIMMPKMGGRETYDRLRRISPDVKVLLWSGAHVNDQVADMLKRGCRGFIQKPFSLRELSREIRQVLDRG